MARLRISKGSSGASRDKRHTSQEAERDEKGQTREADPPHREKTRKGRIRQIILSNAMDIYLFLMYQREKYGATILFLLYY